MVDESPRLIEALSSIVAALGQQPKTAIKEYVHVPQAAQEVTVEEPVVVQEESVPVPPTVTDAELREHTSAAVKRMGQEAVLAILKEVGNTNKIVALTQEERNVFIERISE